MLRRFSISIVQCAILSTLFSAFAQADVQDDARQLLQQGEFSGGFVVHLGAGTGELTAALKQNNATQVQGLEADADKVAAARKRLVEAKQYGEIAIEHFVGKELPYIDNLVNLLLVEQLGYVTMEEVLR